VWVVDEALLERARRAGTADPALADGIARSLTELERRGADVVVCTCSTIGGAAEMIGRRIGVGVVRVDRAMAERAVAIGGKIWILGALESTLAPTRELLESVAADRGVELDVEVELIVGAWERFEADDRDGYLDLIADSLSTLAVGCDVIVLAQASMAEAAERVVVGVPVLSSPRLAVAALVGPVG
jgi:aspartate/glutamate racemase